MTETGKRKPLRRDGLTGRMSRNAHTNVAGENYEFRSGLKRSPLVSSKAHAVGLRASSRSTFFGGVFGFRYLGDANDPAVCNMAKSDPPGPTKQRLEGSPSLL